MRAEELVRRARQVVAIPPLDVQGQMRCEVYRIDEHLGACLVRARDHFPHRRDTAHDVRCGGEGHQPGAAAQLRSPVVQIQRAVLAVDRRLAHGGPGILGRLHPRREVGVVLEGGEQHLVAGAPGAAQGPGQREGEGGHVGAEHHQVRFAAAHQICRRLVRAPQHGITFAAGDELPVHVGVGVGEVAPHGLDDARRHLAARRAVEKDRGLPRHLAPQGRELPAAVSYIERAGHAGRSVGLARSLLLRKRGQGLLLVVVDF